MGGVPVDCGGQWQPWVGGGDHNRCAHARKVKKSFDFDEKMEFVGENPVDG